MHLPARCAVPAVVLALCGVGASSASAADCASGTTAWKRGVSGSWSDATKWTNGVPSVWCDVRILKRGRYTVTLDEPPDENGTFDGRVRTLRLGGDATLDIARGGIEASGDYTQDEGATLVLDLATDGTGVSIFAHGSVSVRGALRVLHAPATFYDPWLVLIDGDHALRGNFNSVFVDTRGLEFLYGYFAYLRQLSASPINLDDTTGPVLFNFSAPTYVHRTLPLQFRSTEGASVRVNVAKTSGVAVGHFTLAANRGLNRFELDARSLPGGLSLKPGNYRLTFVGRDYSYNVSEPKRLVIKVRNS